MLTIAVFVAAPTEVLGMLLLNLLGQIFSFFVSFSFGWKSSILSQALIKNTFVYV